MLLSKISMNLIRMLGLTLRRPAKNAGSSLAVNSLPLSALSLQTTETNIHAIMI